MWSSTLDLTLPDKTLASERRKGRDGAWCFLAAKLLGGSALLVTAVVLLAWLVGLEPAVRVMPGLPTMKFNTALGLLLVALSLLGQAEGLARWMARRTNHRIAKASAIGAGLVASSAMIQMIVGKNLHIDELFVTDWITRASNSSSAPGRMSPATASSMLLLAIAMLVCPYVAIRPRVRWIVWLCAAGALGTGLLAGCALLLSVKGLTHIPFFSTMALHTAWLTVLLGCGVIFAAHGVRHGAASEEPDALQLMYQRRLAIAVIATLAIGLFITLASAHRTQWVARETARLHFERLTDRIADEARRRLELPVYGLKGARGVYAASESVVRREFARYVASRDLPVEFPGVLGMGFIQRVSRDRLDEFIAAERADDAPDFNVTSSRPAAKESENDTTAAASDGDMYIIKYIEPLAQNRAAWGYDVGSEPIRRAAIEQAIRTGVPTLTGRINLVQDERKRAGFLFFVPVYFVGSDLSTEEGRVRSLHGVVYAPLVIDEIFRGVESATKGNLVFAVFEGPHTTADSLLFDFDTSESGSAAGANTAHRGEQRFEATIPLTVGGRVWTIRTRTTPRFFASTGATLPATVSLAGLLLSTIATGLVWTMGRARVRAQELAARMTANLRNANTKIEQQNKDLWMMAERAHHFVDDVSHEFRTPLAAIKEFTSIISDGLAGPVSADQTEYLKIMSNSVIDLNHMVEDLLDSSKLRAGRLRVDRQSHRVDDILAGVRAVLDRKASVRSIVIEERVEPELPRVFADEEKVRRIIANLMTNAIKFSPEGGTIVLSAARANHPGEVVISVTDHGPGLSSEDVDRLFGRFQQTSSARTVAAKGFGLGLSIAQELTWLNLGKLSVVSEKGKGATFSFTLTADDPEVVLANYFRMIETTDWPADELALLRVVVVPAEGANDLDEAAGFLASTTYATDLIVPSPWEDHAAHPKAWWLLGRSQSPSTWVKRLRESRARVISESPMKLASLTIETYGVWPFPAEARLSKEAVRHALGLEPVHALEGADAQPPDSQHASADTYEAVYVQHS